MTFSPMVSSLMQLIILTLNYTHQYDDNQYNDASSAFLSAKRIMTLSIMDLIVTVSKTFY